MELATGIILGAVIVLSYTMVGGFIADATIDTVQMFVTIAGALIVLFVAAATYGSLGTVHEQLPADYSDPFEPWGLFFMVTIFMLWLSDLPLQFNIQRMSAVRNVRTAVFAGTLAGLSYIVILYISPAIGSYARVALPDLQNPDQAYPELAQAMLPAALAAFI